MEGRQRRYPAWVAMQAPMPPMEIGLERGYR